MNTSLQNKTSEKYVFNKVAETYFEISQSEECESEVKFLNEIGLTALAAKDSKLLEIGCFTGSLSFLLSEYGFKVTGVDLASEAIKKANDLAKSQKRAVSFLVADAEELDKYFGKEFDVVFCNCVLHHFPDPSKVIPGISKVLKNEGLFFVAEPNPYNPYNILAYFIKDIVYKYTKPSSSIHTYINSSPLAKILFQEKVFCNTSKKENFTYSKKNIIPLERITQIL